MFWPQWEQIWWERSMMEQEILGHCNLKVWWYQIIHYWLPFKVATHLPFHLIYLQKGELQYFRIHWVGIITDDFQ
jgi:hypothetical protein